MPVKKKTTRKKPPKNAYKVEEWQWPQDASISGKPWPKHYRIQRLKNLAEEIGIENINKSKIAKEFGVSRVTLYEDFLVVYQMEPAEEMVQQVQIRAKNTYTTIQKALMQDLINLSRDLKTSKDKQIALATARSRTAQVLLQCQKDQAEWLERFGMKEPNPNTTASEFTLKWQTPEVKEEPHGNTPTDTTEKRARLA